MSECPDNIKSNGKICTPNTIGGCSVGYTCIKQSGLSTGFCCAIQPKCLRGKTEYIVAEQVFFIKFFYYFFFKIHYFILNQEREENNQREKVK